MDAVRPPSRAGDARRSRPLHRRLDPWLTVTFHQPLFGVGANDTSMHLVREIAAGMRLPVDEFHCTGVCDGTFTGWVNHRTEGHGADGRVRPPGAVLAESPAPPGRSVEVGSDLV